MQYNSVDFGKKALKTINANVFSPDAAVLQVRVNAVDGPVIADIKIPSTKEWTTVNAPVLKSQIAVKNLFVVLKGGGLAEVDWVRFQ